MTTTGKTITVSWTTHIQEHHTAEIPEGEWVAMLNAETFDDDLAQYEREAFRTDVTGRDVNEIGEA